MKVKIEFEDIGSQTVAMTSDIIVTGKEKQEDKPTPAVVLGLATRALYENGMLARVGQIALEGMSKGEVPTECILAAFKETKDDPNTR